MMMIYGFLLVKFCEKTIIVFKNNNFVTISPKKSCSQKFLTKFTRFKFSLLWPPVGLQHEICRSQVWLQTEIDKKNPCCVLCSGAKIKKNDKEENDFNEDSSAEENCHPCCRAGDRDGGICRRLAAFRLLPMLPILSHLISSLPHSCSYYIRILVSLLFILTRLGASVSIVCCLVRQENWTRFFIVLWRGLCSDLFFVSSLESAGYWGRPGNGSLWNNHGRGVVMGRVRGFLLFFLCLLPAEYAPFIIYSLAQRSSWPLMFVMRGFLWIVSKVCC